MCSSSLCVSSTACAHSLSKAAEMAHCSCECRWRYLLERQSSAKHFQEVHFKGVPGKGPVDRQRHSSPRKGGVPEISLAGKSAPQGSEVERNQGHHFHCIQVVYAPLNSTPMMEHGDCCAYILCTRGERIQTFKVAPATSALQTSGLT